MDAELLSSLMLCIHSSSNLAIKHQCIHDTDRLWSCPKSRPCQISCLQVALKWHLSKELPPGNDVTFISNDYWWVMIWEADFLFTLRDDRNPRFDEGKTPSWRKDKEALPSSRTRQCWLLFSQTDGRRILTISASFPFQKHSLTLAVAHQRWVSVTWPASDSWPLSFSRSVVGASDKSNTFQSNYK